MAESNLSAETLRTYFSYDPSTGYFTRRGEQTPSGRIATKGYRQICIKGRRYMAHRLAWLYVYGVWPINKIDHINHRKDDNRIENLREVTDKQNNENMPTATSNSSGRRGVYWSAKSQKWTADIKHHSKNIYLGLFDCLLDAVAARIRAEMALFTHTPLAHEFPHLVAQAAPILEVRRRPRAPLDNFRVSVYSR